MEPVLFVNVDVVFLLNFLVNLPWLWATGRLAGVRARFWRLALAAAIGAAAVVWAYDPSGRWLVSAGGMALGTAALLFLGYGPCRPWQFLRLLAYFLLLGGAMTGAVVLVGTKGGPVGAVIPDLLLSIPVVVGLVLCFFGGRSLWEAARERRHLAGGLYRLRVILGEQSVEVPALLDTGNSLRDPLSGTPVAVVETAALQAILPGAVLGAVRAGWDALGQMPVAWSSRCRLVPFRAVGQSGGVLLAFAPDQLSVQAPGGERWATVTALVGLAAEPLHPGGAYQALLSPHLLEAVEGVPGEMWEGETG